MKEKNDKKFIFYVHLAKFKNEYGNYGMYFGITEQKLKDRWRKDGKGYKKRNKNDDNYSYFWNSINKHGWDNFEHIVLVENLKKDDAKKIETFFITKFNTHDRKYGYNGTLGGEHNIPNEETRQKMSKTKKEKYANGELVVWNKGKKCPQLSGKNNGFYGKKHTEEEREKMRANSWNRTHSGSLSPSAKKYIRLSDNKVYNSGVDCISDNNISKHILYKHCNNQNKTKPQEFMYYTDYLKSLDNNTKI